LLSTYNLEKAFDAALMHVERSLATGMKTAEWVPDTEISLIAALGRLVRVARPALS
jgi:hypothetical protein